MCENDLSDDGRWIPLSADRRRNAVSYDSYSENHRRPETVGNFIIKVLMDCYWNVFWVK